ncbi:hypothetical protein [Pelomonas caseinilytica]|uniref:hypothetical protein n=1 Tax=Pelomonas caseinilytica TaxID=2906763 RepID=UPI001F1861DB|nr:hypothetical protein [Pelomonas sp. P7]
MPTKPPHSLAATRISVLAAMAGLVAAAHAQTDDAAPFYAGGSLGVSHVSNVYREASAPNSDTVISAGLLAGVDRRLGRQHLTLDGSLQDNRYSTNKDLNYRSHSVRAALNWQTVGDLSGVLSAKSDRSLADFNVGIIGIEPIRVKNVERDEEYQAIARLGVGTRYTVEAGWTRRNRDFTAQEYDRLVYRQNTESLGVYATPAGNVKLGLVGRHTKGNNPRYTLLVPLPGGGFALTSTRNDYTRNDLDFTTNWRLGGHSNLNTRISRSRTTNGLEILRDFSGTTGAVGWIWTPTAKLQLNLQYSRDTGQESVVRSADLNRVYRSWRLGANYALTGKVSLSGNFSDNRARRTSDSGAVLADAQDATTNYSLGLRWSIYRGFSLSCQYDHASRDSSVPQYVYSASSYGCTGQAILY